jgi:hypothetical protein
MGWEDLACWFWAAWETYGDSNSAGTAEACRNIQLYSAELPLYWVRRCREATGRLGTIADRFFPDWRVGVDDYWPTANQEVCATTSRVPPSQQGSHKTYMGISRVHTKSWARMVIRGWNLHSRIGRESTQAGAAKDRRTKLREKAKGRGSKDELINLI